MRKKLLTVEFDDTTDMNLGNIYLRWYHIFISILCIVGIIFSLPVITTLLVWVIWIYLFDKYITTKEENKKEVKFEEMREVFNDTQKLIDLRKEIGIIHQKYRI